MITVYIRIFFLKQLPSSWLEKLMREGSYKTLFDVTLYL